MSASLPTEQAALAVEFRSACDILEGVGVLGLLLAPDGSIVASNRPLADILGKGAAEGEGGPIWPLLNAEARLSLSASCQAPAEGRRGGRDDLQLAGRWYDCRWTSRYGSSGQLIGLILLATDPVDPREPSEAAAAAARDSEAIRRQALENAPDAVFAIDRGYRLIFNNQLHQRLLTASGGLPLQAGEFVLSPHYPPEVLAYWRTAYDRALNGEQFRLDTEWTNPEGRTQVFDNIFTPLRDGSGAIIGVLIVARDVTDRHRAEQALRDSEQRFATVFHESPQAIAISRLADGQFLEVNDAFVQLYGYAREELLGHTSTELRLWHSGNREAVVGKLREHGGRQIVEMQARRKDGEIRDLLASIAHIRLRGERCMVGFLSDLTDRKQAEAALRASETRYRELFDHMNSGVAVYRAVDDGQDFVFVDLNRAGETIDQDSREHLLGKRLTETRPGAADFGLLELLRRVWKTGVAEHLPIREYQDHRLRAWYDNYVYRLPSGEVVAIFDNVTEHRQAEEEIRRQAGLIRSLLDSVPDVVFYKDVHGVHLGCNTAHAEFVGRRREEIIGKTDYDLFAPEVAEAFRLRDREVLDTLRAARNEEWAVAADGTRILYDTLRTPYLSPDGKLLGVLGVSRDITERERLEEERAAARAWLAAVEEKERHRLARELHDQTAQRLVALAVELKNLETNLGAGRSQTERVKALRQAVDELQQQVRQMAWDLRAGEVVEGDLARALQEYTEDWSERVGMPVDFASRSSSGRRLPALLESTLYRVAQEALANIERHAQARRVSVLLECEETLVRLTVEDDGRGFDVDAAQGSYESSRRLGLLGMRERVILAGGTLLVESSPGAGVTLLVRLPVPAEAKPS